MKDLFKSRFPFVDLPDSELTEDQKNIKKLYETYDTNKASEIVVNAIEAAEQAIDASGLRDVRSNDKRTGKRTK